MNILILNWRDIKNPSSGGAEILTHEIAKRWVSWGHSVTQFSSSFQGSLNEETLDGVKIIRRGHPGIRYIFSSVHFLAFWHYQRKFRGNFDFIIDEIHGIPFFTPWYVKEKKVALICEVAVELWKKMFGPIFGLLGEVAEKFYLRTIYKDIPYLTISNSTKEDLMKNGVQEKNIILLPMGVSVPGSLEPSKKGVKLTLLFVGRLTPAKGLVEGIIALKKISKKIPDVRLWVVGRGDEQYLQSLKKLSQRLNVYNRITFFGFVSEQKKFELMGRANILIHPSLREGFGLTIPEAGLTGTPVIAYNSPGIRDVVRNGKNGILVSENLPKSIADSVMLLWSNKSYYKKLCKGAQEEAKQYSWDNTAREALAFLEDMRL